MSDPHRAPVAAAVAGPLSQSCATHVMICGIPPEQATGGRKRTSGSIGPCMQSKARRTSSFSSSTASRTVVPHCPVGVDSTIEPTLMNSRGTVSPPTHSQPSEAEVRRNVLRDRVRAREALNMILSDSCVGAQPPHTKKARVHLVLF